jgi:fructokinase
MMMPDVIATGELLVDFVSTVSGVSLADAPSFLKAAGGAPANVVVGLARLGVSSGFMGQVGDDAFGHFLANTLSANNVDVSALRFSDKARTALAFVSVRADAERDFMFYRHPSADMLYDMPDVNADYVQASKILHFGSLSLIAEPSRRATFFAVFEARKSGVLVSYDPNLRVNLWPDAQQMKAMVMEGWGYAQVIKVSGEELALLSGENDIEAGARQLWHNDLRLLVVTRGANGCAYFTRELSGEVAGFKVNVVDTTGAGDGFMAGLLKGVLASPHIFFDETRLREACRYANAVGALTTTQRGAIPALPTHEAVMQLMMSSELTTGAITEMQRRGENKISASLR